MYKNKYTIIFICYIIWISIFDKYSILKLVMLFHHNQNLKQEIIATSQLVKKKHYELQHTINDVDYILKISREKWLLVPENQEIFIIINPNINNNKNYLL